MTTQRFVRPVAAAVVAFVTYVVTSVVLTLGMPSATGLSFGVVAGSALTGTVAVGCIIALGLLTSIAVHQVRPRPVPRAWAVAAQAIPSTVLSVAAVIGILRDRDRALDPGGLLSFWWNTPSELLGLAAPVAAAAIVFALLLESSPPRTAANA